MAISYGTLFFENIIDGGTTGTWTPDSPAPDAFVLIVQGFDNSRPAEFTVSYNSGTLTALATGNSDSGGDSDEGRVSIFFSTDVTGGTFRASESVLGARWQYLVIPVYGISLTAEGATVSDSDTGITLTHATYGNFTQIVGGLIEVDLGGFDNPNPTIDGGTTQIGSQVSSGNTEAAAGFVAKSGGSSTAWEASPAGGSSEGGNGMAVVGLYEDLDETVTASLGSLTLTAPTVDSVTPAVTVSVNTGSVTLTAPGADIQVDATITPDAGQVSFTSAQPDIVTTATIGAASPGSVALSGPTATVVTGFVIAANAGSFALSGSSPALVTTANITAQTGDVALSSSAPQVIGTANIGAPSPGSVALSSAAPLVIKSYLAQANAGTLTLTGLSPAAPITTANITAQAGTVSLTGLIPAIIEDRIIPAPAPGVLGLAGQSVSLGFGANITAPVGALTLSGFTVTRLGGVAPVRLRTDASIRRLFNMTFTHQRKSRTSDGQGGFTETLDSVWSFRGRMRNASFNEVEYGAKLRQYVTHVVYCDAALDIRESDELVTGDTRVRVHAIKEPSHAGHHLEVLCERLETL